MVLWHIFSKGQGCKCGGIGQCLPAKWEAPETDFKGNSSKELSGDATVVCPALDTDLYMFENVCDTPKESA